MADTVAKLLSESAEVEIFYHPHGIAPLGLVLSLDPVTAPGLAQIHAGVLAAASGQVLWSGSTALTLSEPEATGSGLAFARFAFQTAEAAQAALPGLRGRPDTVPCADILIAEAIDDLFSFVPDRLQKAETRLVLAGKLRASPRSLAWRAFLRRVMVLERVGGDTVTLAKEALVLASQAQDLGAGNALVLGLCSQVHAAFDGAADAAAILARDALVLSPCNAHAHAAQAVALLRGGRIGAARLAAVRGASVATGSLRQHWWDHIAGQTALAIGDLPAAITAFEAAHSRAPAFRSPLRNLVNLYHRTGDTARHLRALGALQRIAPDMTGADDGDENDGPGRAAPPTPHPKDQDQMSWISQIPPTPARTA
jgi:hypothetical protein